MKSKSLLKIKHGHVQKHYEITCIHMKIYKHAHKLIKKIKFLPDNIENMWIFYQT